MPHDTAGLVELFGSRDKFVNELQTFFLRARWFNYTILPNLYYWGGNEQELFAVYMFSYVGRPDLTQEYSRWLLDNIFTTQPNGYPGNDDYGTMSAWYMFTSAGFYPLAGSS